MNNNIWGISKIVVIAIMNADLIRLRNLRVELQNKHVYDNYDKILKNKKDIDKLIIASSNARREISKYSGTSFPIGADIKSIKSVDNGAILALNPVGELDMYQVNINGQCLTVYGKNSVMLKPCQGGSSISDSQKFHTTRIMTPLAAKTVMNANYVSPTNVYPYNIFRSNMTGQCMTLNNDGDMIMKPCNPNNLKQQWLISPNENICSKEL